jgi:sortase A
VTVTGTREFRVAFSDVVDSRVQHMVLDPAVSRLTLVTCYPFDAVSAGGPLRYVITALPA